MAAQPAPEPETRRQPSKAEAAALASEIRLRIIRLTSDRALTNKEIAQRLGKDPATTLHHVRKLVANGFLEALPERRGTRGAKEIPYRSTRLSWQLAGGGVEPGIDEAMLGAFLSEVAEVGPAALNQTRLVLQLAEHHRAEFEKRLYALFDEFADRPLDPDGERLAVYLALYPGD